jgi:RimJ/RimL family protein N-acetyltransferase
MMHIELLKHNADSEEGTSDRVWMQEYKDAALRNQIARESIETHGVERPEADHGEPFIPDTFAIYDRLQSPEAIGLVSIHPFQDAVHPLTKKIQHALNLFKANDATPEPLYTNEGKHITFFLNEGYENRGFGTKAISQALNFVYGDTKRDKIYAHYSADNHASERVQEKLSFRTHLPQNFLQMIDFIGILRMGARLNSIDRDTWETSRVMKTIQDRDPLD